MSEILIYETSDPAFASRAIDALQAEGIDCFKTGRGYADIRAGIKQDLGSGICIFIRQSEDYSRANQILIGLGAFINKPVRLPSRKTLVLVGIFIALMAFLLSRA